MEDGERAERRSVLRLSQVLPIIPVIIITFLQPDSHEWGIPTATSSSPAHFNINGIFIPRASGGSRLLQVKWLFLYSCCFKHVFLIETSHDELLTNIGMIQDLHYSNFSEELRRGKKKE